MVWYIVSGVAAIVLLVRLVGYIRYRRLDWPSSLSYYAYRRNTIRYMRRLGWTIDQRVWVVFDFWADKKGNRLAVVLMPPGMELTKSKIRDVSASPPETWFNRSIVIVTHEEVPRHLVDDAANVRIRVVCYKALAEL